MVRKSLKEIVRKQYREIHLQLVPEQGETALTFAEKIAEILYSYNAKIIRASFFGNLSQLDPTIEHIADNLAGINFPYSWIEGDKCAGTFINGVYIFAVSGIEVKHLFNNGKIVGSYFQTAEADFCFLGGLYSDPAISIPGKQTENILVLADNLLHQVGLSYDNTIRTWFYLDNILDWYNEFNKARTSFFLQHDIFNKLVPASTGIGGRNPEGSRVGLEVTAIKPKNKQFLIEKVESPLQRSPAEYGSSFSRAVRYSDGEYSILTVSGTASINPEGKTMYPDDLGKQIELSLNVVKAIMESQDFKFNNIIRSYAYCSDKKFTDPFMHYLKNYFPAKYAFICSENKICRKDLMFEIEVDAVKKIKLNT
jgi:enamine deaminase RidA (YjgF/YER057c/UK114 family)